jgi:hypothetical protein
VSVKIHASRAGTPVGLLESMTNEAGVEIFGEAPASPTR